MRSASRFPAAALSLALGVLLPGAAAAQKVFINYSNQTSNSVCAGGVESTYAADNASIAAGILRASGFDVQTSDDFYGSNAAAASWGAVVFLSVHSNAGGGHGTETLKGWYGDSTNFAGKVQAALLAKMPYQSRGVKDGSCGGGRCKVLNYSGQTAALPEVLFHDCCTSSGYAGHPPSEAAYLVDATKRQIIGAGLAQGICDYFGKSCGTAPPADGNIMGVVYTNGDINQHVAPATLTLSTGATTTYDGSKLWRFDVPPGTYSVTASAAGYKTGTRDCPNPVTSGATSWCSIELVADTATTGTLEGVVYQNGDPANHVAPATVAVEGGASATYDGTAKWSFTLAPGSYTVTVSAAGYQTRTLACPTAVTAGGAAQCDVELTKDEPPDAGAATDQDAAASAGDSGQAAGDAGGARDGGTTKKSVDSGCGCSSGAGGALGLLALPWALRTLRRRRPRS